MTTNYIKFQDDNDSVAYYCLSLSSFTCMFLVRIQYMQYYTVAECTNTITVCLLTQRNPPGA